MTDSSAAPLVALLIEDDPADAELIAIRLESTPSGRGAPLFRLINASSANAGCSVLRHTAVDVVILDLTLPDASDLEALHRVRNAAPDVPVMVLTGIGDQRMAVRALRAGAQDYVLKPPPDGPTLSRILRYACERNRLLQEIDAARRASATSANRWRLLAEIGKAFVSASDPVLAIAQLPSIVVPHGADCFVLVVGGNPLIPMIVEAGHVDSARVPEVRQRVGALVSESDADFGGFVSAVTSAPADTDVGSANALRAMISSFGVTSSTAVPVRFGGRVHGFVVLGVCPGSRVALPDAAFAQSIADAIGMALEQDRLLREMRAAIAARDRAVSIVSHDLCNPLSTILLCATALLDPVPPPTSGVREMAELIKRSSEWMQHIVQDLLDRASLDAGRLTLHCRLVSTTELTRAIALLYEPLAREHSIDLVLSDDPGIDLEADPDRLLQALSNLLGNAIKFTPAGGRVELTSALETAVTETGRHEAPAIRFTVHDTGPGISAEDLTHVFDWFWRSPDGRDGAGLGLAIAKGLIEAHRGRLRVESTVGRGSTFWFTLPALLRNTSPQNDLEMSLS